MVATLPYRTLPYPTRSYPTLPTQPYPTVDRKGKGGGACGAARQAGREGEGEGGVEKRQGLGGEGAQRAKAQLWPSAGLQGRGGFGGGGRPQRTSQALPHNNPPNPLTAKREAGTVRGLAAAQSYMFLLADTIVYQPVGELVFTILFSPVGLGGGKRKSRVAAGG